MSKRKTPSSPLEKQGEPPVKKQKREEQVEERVKNLPTIFSLDGLLGISNTIGRSRLETYEQAVQLLKKHNDQKGDKVNPKLKSVADEATRDIEDIKKSKISIAIVGPAGQGKSTFGNRFLWNKENENFPLITSDLDHKTSRSVYCKTSNDKKWRVKLRVVPDPSKESTPVNFHKIVLEHINSRNSLQEFLEDPHSQCPESVTWNSVLSIHIQGPFNLDKGLTIIDTPGWNFNFGPNEDEKPLRATIKQALKEATVLVLLSMASRIQGKEDIQTLLEKIPPRDEPPVIVPAWACASAPQRTHAEKIRHALQTLKADTSLGKVNDSDETFGVSESVSDPWERYELFDQMIQKTLLFTVPYSFNYLREFVEQLKDKFAHPKFVKIHWAFKTFTFLRKRDKKDEDKTIDPRKLADVLEEKHKALIKSKWKEEVRIEESIDDVCEQIWDDLLAKNNPTPPKEALMKKPFADSGIAMLSAVVSLKRTAILSYAKIFIQSVEQFQGKTKKKEKDDTDSEDEATPPEIVTDDYYKFLEENFQRNFNFSVKEPSVSAAFRAVFSMANKFDGQMKELYKKLQSRLDESPTYVYEIDEESDTYNELKKKFTERIHYLMQQAWETTFNALKSAVGNSIAEILVLLRLDDDLSAIAKCVKDVKLNNLAAVSPGTPLTAKDPLVHIFKFSDFSSELDKGIASIRNVKRETKPWTWEAKEETSTKDQIITASQFTAKVKERHFSFRYTISTSATGVIDEFREKLNTAAALDYTLFPMFVICPFSSDTPWRQKKKLFNFTSLDPDAINNQLLMFLVMPASLYAEYKTLVQKQPVSESFKKRIYYVLLDGIEENTTAALYLDVIKILAEKWKLTFYWKLSLNAFYPMGELDLANFGRRQISLARGLLLMQNMIHNYRYNVAQEFSKILRETKVNQAVTRVIGRSDNEEHVDIHTLVKDRTPFVSFAALVKLVHILEECTGDQKFETESDKEKLQTLKTIITKFNDLLQKFSVVCAVDNRSLYQKLAACFPYLFSIESSKLQQIRYLSLNNTFKVLSRNYAKKDTDETEDFLQDLANREKELADRCKSLHKALVVVTPYVMFTDGSRR
eukprot:TRINITY_DN2687_c0_g2_i1.p1 TRINITY_DN2687_c0_g2~~TRINITY_DN2687_c0_g2_i1.p1  ORF type:complete len:1091 (-),score=155.82 TRINITY_DN2687_c0_g2_i1:75-3347(-)